MSFTLVGAVGPRVVKAPDLTTVAVSVHGIKHDRGTIRIALFDSKESWLKTPIRTGVVEPDSLPATLSLDGLATGTYAVAAFHDLNGNGRNDKNFLGIPKEPWAVSNDARGRFGPPSWDDSIFEVKTDTTMVVRLTR